MHFCTICENMYYIRLSKDKEMTTTQLVYYCRKCGHEDDSLGNTVNNICVSKTAVKKKEGGLRHLVNQYTKLDPTLPRVTNIPCPNPACKSNRKSDEDGMDDPETTTPHEVIYLRYNDAALKFVYICNSCDTVWKSAENK